MKKYSFEVRAVEIEQLCVVDVAVNVQLAIALLALL